MKFYDLMEEKVDPLEKSPVMKMLHHFGDFVSIIDESKPDSDMYIDALKSARKPDELMQLCLDFIRCIYEPKPMGTWLLNGNPEFFADALDESNNNILYCSSTANVSSDFGDHYQKVIAASLESQGFDINQGHTAFAIITASESHLKPDLIESITDVLIDNFTFDEEGHHSIIHTGFCRDDALGELVRVSMMVVS